MKTKKNGATDPICCISICIFWLYKFGRNTTQQNNPKAYIYRNIHWKSTAKPCTYHILPESYSRYSRLSIPGSRSWIGITNFQFISKHYEIDNSVPWMQHFKNHSLKNLYNKNLKWTRISGFHSFQEFIWEECVYIRNVKTSSTCEHQHPNPSLTLSPSF